MTFEQKLRGGREQALKTLVVQAEGTVGAKVSERGMALDVHQCSQRTGLWGGRGGKEVGDGVPKQ